MRERGREEFEREGVRGKRVEGGRKRGRERGGKLVTKYIPIKKEMMRILKVLKVIKICIV